MVASVAEGSPSEDAGIKAGDIILEFDGKTINEMNELPKIVAATDVGKKVNVKVWRNQRELTKVIILGRLETSTDFKPQQKVLEKPKENFSITAKIVNVSKPGDYKIYINLENNQTWRSVKDFYDRAPVSKGQTVSISEGFISGYVMKVEGKKTSLRVRRVK